MKIVVFDDELYQRQALYKLPETELVFFEHADDAVAVVQAERPDVVLMDFTMYAQHSGSDAITRLRRVAGRPGEARLRIIAISTDIEANERMLADGADDAVPKSHLRGYLQKLLEADRLARLSDRL